jgi:hypothetical protein
VGEVPGQRVVVEGVKGVKYTPMPPDIYERRKTSGFPHFLAYKSPKTLFFAQKYLTRYTPEMFFEEYINFNIFHYLSHCEVSKVIYVHPQPPGLGLKYSKSSFPGGSNDNSEQSNCCLKMQDDFQELSGIKNQQKPFELFFAALNDDCLAQTPPPRTEELETTGGG